MKVINYHSDEGQRTGLLVSTGRKFHQVILMDYPIRIRKVPLADERRFKDLEHKGKPYPLARCKRHLRHAIKTWHGGMKNVSKGVREALA
jgi:hypothetical protein